MRHSLWFRLMAVFLVVIATGVVVVTLISNAASARQFSLFVSRRGEYWSAQVAPQFEAYYASRGSWDGIQASFAAPFGGTLPDQDTGMMGGMMDDAHMEGMTDGGMMSGGMWNAMSIRLLLTDAQGEVVADTEGELVSRQLSDEALSQGTPLVVDADVVGYIVATDLSSASTPSIEADFLHALNRSVLLAALAAAGAALVTGTVLFRRITRPLSDLSRAAQRVATGDLETRVSVSGRDELSYLATAFNQMADGLAQQQALRRQMVADIAHELRTPISVMQGALEAMLDGILSPDREELRSLHDETLHLARLVADLRTLSLADAGQLALEFQEVDVGELVEDVARRMEVMADEKGIQLRTRISGNFPIQADAQRLTQVFTNLLANALQYTLQGGEISAEVKRHDGQVRVTVADTGPGIPADALPYIFDRFWRGDKSRNRAGGGSGLGLAIVRHLVELHGGTVKVVSMIGRGTTFTVSLPSDLESRDIEPD